jgi:hypothetical protein
MQQRVASQLQGESRFFYRRGILSLLEGDMPAAKRRFQQANRRPPEGWGLPTFGHQEAGNFLQLITLAERRSLAP